MAALRMGQDQALGRPESGIEHISLNLFYPGPLATVGTLVLFQSAGIIANVPLLPEMPSDI
jgi:hypothetical protein